MNELSLFVLDIAQNSAEAGATLVEILADEQEKITTIAVTDNGCGMSKTAAGLAVNTPYSTKGEGRGGGLPGINAAANRSGGELKVYSEQGRGTRVEASFLSENSPKMGDINSTVRLFAVCHPELDVVFRRKVFDKEFELDTRRIKKELGRAASTAALSGMIREYLNEQTKIIFGGAADEING